MTERQTFHVQAIAVPDAVERAKARARLEGWTIVTLALVAPKPPGAWDVTLIVRGKGA